MAAIQALHEETLRVAMLIGDTDAAQTSVIAVSAARAGWRTVVCKDVAQSIELLSSASNPAVACIMIDEDVLSNADFAVAVAQLKRSSISTPVVLLSSRSGSKDLIEALRAGASDYLIKPIGSQRLLDSLRSVTATRWHTHGDLEALANQVPAEAVLTGLVGNDSHFRRAVAKAALCSRGTGHVVVEGEAGTGKRTLAAAICSLSERHKHVVHSMNARSSSEVSLESALFGHQEGAFVGAFEGRDGLLKVCTRGTLIIQEINRLPLDLQESLGRTLASKRLNHLGSKVSFPLDVRVIGLSNVPLRPLLENGRFSSALYEQLSATRIWLPPLRERLGDVELIAGYWLARFADGKGANGMTLSKDALAQMARFPWPGNIAQLQSVIARAVATTTSHVLVAQDFALLDQSMPDSPAAVEAARTSEWRIRLFNDDGHIRELWEIEIDVIRLAVAHYRGRLAQVARHLGISRSTLYRKLDEYGIDASSTNPGG